MKNEKTIHEFKVTETEDGYRIEIKGDKEQLKKAGLPGILPFLGPRMRFRGYGPRKLRRRLRRHGRPGSDGPRGRRGPGGRRRRWGNPPSEGKRRPGEPPFWQGGPWGGEMGDDGPNKGPGYV